MAVDQKPDFSGEYALNRQACTLSPGADTVVGAVLRIEHREPTIRCSASFAFADSKFEYSLERMSDGREVAGQLEGHGSIVSSLRWEDKALVFTDITTGPDAEVTMTWRYELLEGRLRAAERIRGGGRDQDNVWVFERQ